MALNRWAKLREVVNSSSHEQRTFGGLKGRFVGKRSPVETTDFRPTIKLQEATLKAPRSSETFPLSIAGPSPFAYPFDSFRSSCASQLHPPSQLCHHEVERLRYRRYASAPANLAGRPQFRTRHDDEASRVHDERGECGGFFRSKNKKILPLVAARASKWSSPLSSESSKNRYFVVNSRSS